MKGLSSAQSESRCVAVALATQQLDVYFEKELQPFQKLLLAVVAEHMLLAAKVY